MDTRRHAVVLLAMLVVCSGALLAQTSTTTGQIVGRVSDNSAAPLPGVTVTAENVEAGLTRTVYTDSQGSYTVELLPPGKYRVTGELAGLGVAKSGVVTVLLGKAARVDLALTPTVSEEITVSAQSPVVDTTESSPSEAVTESQIENLPILGRDFKDLVLLTPGVANSFGGRVALVGARGTAVDYNIDGANANSDFFAEERGGTAAPFVFSQAAIKEFQVIRTTYSAEYSRGGGGTMNAITKSGTNNYKGEAFWFHRDKDWADERSVPGITEFFDPRNADQYGFAVGGPLMKDKLFFFVNGDFQDIKEPFNTADLRTDSGFLALPAQTQQALVSRLEGLLGHPLAEEFAYDTKENQKTLLGKVDGNVGNSNHFSVRWNYSDFNNFPSESSGTLSNQGDEYNTVNSGVAQLDSIISSSMYNFALLQYSLEERPINALNTTFPQTNITVGNRTFTFGQRDFLPNGTDEKKWELKDTFSWVTGQHQIKTGFNYLTVDIANLFVRDRSGDYYFNSAQDFLDNKPREFQQGIGEEGSSGVTAFDFNQWGLFAMDTWNPITKLTLEYGIRYDFQSMPKPSRNVYAATNPELIDNFQTDDNNFAPRLGFAYDLKGNGRSVIRGGIGKYFNFVPGILLAQPLQQTSGLFNNYVFRCSATVACPTFPNLFSATDLANANATASLDLTTVSPDLEAGEAIRGSLGFEQQLWESYSVEVEGIWADYSKQQRLVNVNAVPTGIVFGNLPQYTTSGTNKPYPAFRDVRMHVSDADGSYKGVTLGIRKMALGGEKLSWLAHYTWSESIDQDTNSRSTSTSFSYDPYNSKLSEGPSDTDITHRIVASATYELPYGFLVSGIFNWHTGQPYTRNIFFSGGSGSLTGLSRIGVNVPVFVDGDGHVIDITQASGSTPAEFAAFLNARNAKILGRNTANQPDFTNVDLRVAKRFPLIYGVELELIGEVFNVFNEANKFITSFNQNEFTIRQTGSGSNIQYTITRNNNFAVPNGLDFNSPPRQYQAALKVRF